MVYILYMLIQRRAWRKIILIYSTFGQFFGVWSPVCMKHLYQAAQYGIQA